MSPNGGLLPSTSRAFYPISVPSVLGFPHQRPFLFETLENHSLLPGHLFPTHTSAS